MSRNGSGVYTLPTTGFKPAVSGQTITASDWNTVAGDLETALTNSIANDGQTVCSARIPFAAGTSSFLGTVSGVSYSFSSDPNTGMYSPTADKLGFVAGGTEIVRVESGLLAPVLTNTIDLGTSSIKYKDAYFAGNLSIGGTVNGAFGGTFSDAALNVIDGLTPAADKMIYFTSGTTGALADITSFARTVLDDSTAATARQTLGVVDVICIPVSDETTALTTGTAKVTFRMPFPFTLTAVRASVTTAPTGSVLTVDINEGGTTILSTKLTIDASEKTSTTAATPAVISDSSLADDAEMTIDIDGVGSTVAGAGLKIYMIGRQG